MTLREEILQDSGILTENKLFNKIAMLKAPRDVFELIGDFALYGIYRDMCDDMSAFRRNWNSLDTLVRDYEPSKSEEVRKLVHEIFDNIKKGKKKFIDEKYAFKYAYGNKNKETIDKYHDKAERKILDYFDRIDMIRDRILENLNRYDSRYKEYRGDK